MILILAHPHDLGAAAVWRTLRSAAAAPSVRMVTGEALATARWDHHIGPDGRATTSVVVDRGEPPLPSEPGAVLNRLQYAGAPALSRSDPQDRAYGMMEMHALLLSWLHSLACPVVNRPQPPSLSGAIRSTPEWLAIAAEVGLPVRGYQFCGSPRSAPKPGFRRSGSAHTQLVLGRQPSSYRAPAGPNRQRVLIAGQRVHAAGLPHAVATGCLALARRSRCDLLECDFCIDEADRPGWSLDSVSAFPPLDRPEQAAIVAALLCRLATPGAGA